jgi:hypothetical protein
MNLVIFLHLYFKKNYVPTNLGWTLAPTPSAKLGLS